MVEALATAERALGDLLIWPGVFFFFFFFFFFLWLVSLMWLKVVDT